MTSVTDYSLITVLTISTVRLLLPTHCTNSATANFYWGANPYRRATTHSYAIPITLQTELAGTSDFLSYIKRKAGIIFRLVRLESKCQSYLNIGDKMFNSCRKKNMNRIFVIKVAIIITFTKTRILNTS
jgi:hypothetical protein